MCGGSPPFGENAVAAGNSFSSWACRAASWARCPPAAMTLPTVSATATVMPEILI